MYTQKAKPVQLAYLDQFVVTSTRKTVIVNAIVLKFLSGTNLTLEVMDL